MSERPLDTPVQVRKDVTIQRDGETGIVLDLNANIYFELNRTGLHIWERLADGVSAEDIAVDLAAAFEVPVPQAREAVVGLVEELDRAGLLEGSAQTGGRLRRLFRRFRT